MKKALFLLLVLCSTTSAFAQNNSGGSKRSSRTGQAAGYSSRDATVLSMMGWGVGLAIGIGALCALIDNHNATSGSGSNSH